MGLTRHLSTLSHRERVGQLVVVAISADNTRADEIALELIAKVALGGFVIRWGSPASVAALTNRLQAASPLPLIFAADYERGVASQCRGGTALPSLLAVGATNDPALAYVHGAITAREMRAIGVRWLLGPVADLSTDESNPSVDTRSLGADHTRAAALIAAMVAGIQENGVAATAKHFPGGGESSVNPHLALPILDIDRERFDQVEAVPFRAAIGAGVMSVMTGHYAAPRMSGDDVPASLSAALTTGVLRGELDFDGVVVTDSLKMSAVVELGAEAAVLALIAGADVVLMPADPAAVIEAVVSAVDNGRLTKERIDVSVSRILAMKQQFGLFAERFVDVERIADLMDSPEAAAVARLMAERGLKQQSGPGPDLPLRGLSDLWIVLCGSPSTCAPLLDELVQGNPHARWRLVHRKSLAPERQAALRAARTMTEGCVVVAVYQRANMNTATLDFHAEDAELLTALGATGQPMVVIILGHPRLAAYAPEGATVLVAHGDDEPLQRAAVRRVLGERSSLIMPR